MTGAYGISPPTGKPVGKTAGSTVCVLARIFANYLAEQAGKPIFLTRITAHGREERIDGLPGDGEEAGV
jgi:hypothetical protein